MSKGSNSSGLRRYNERVLITSLRKMGQASKLELARLANLTPQAVTRIVDDLEAVGLVRAEGRRFLLSRLDAERATELPGDGLDYDPLSRTAILGAVPVGVLEQVIRDERTLGPLLC